MIRVWRIPFSTNVERVALALGHKGLEAEWVDVDRNDRTAVIEASGQPLVPVLEDDGKLVADSTAILEYLEERFPEPALLPTCAFLRARVRKCVEIVNSGVQPMQNLRTMNAIKALGGDAMAFAKDANERGLAALEVEAAETGGPHLVGEQLTLADVYLVPQVYSARRFDVDMSKYPLVTAIDARLAEHPAIQAAHPSKQIDATP